MFTSFFSPSLPSLFIRFFFPFPAFIFFRFSLFPFFLCFVFSCFFLHYLSCFSLFLNFFPSSIFSSFLAAFPPSFFHPFLPYRLPIPFILSISLFSFLSGRLKLNPSLDRIWKLCCLFYHPWLISPLALVHLSSLSRALFKFLFSSIFQFGDLLLG